MAEGYVYFVQGGRGGRVKIGFTAESPDGRLANLQGASPVPLIRLGLIRGPREFEQLLHLRFADQRRHLEWFCPSKFLLEFLGQYAHPWAAPIPPSLRHCGVPWTCSADRVVAADPWFLAQLRRAREDLRAPRLRADARAQARRMFDLCRPFGWLGKALERSPGEKLPPPPGPDEWEDPIAFVFSGGPADGATHEYPRRMVRSIYRAGVRTVEGGAPCFHLYTPADPWCESARAAETITLHHRGPVAG